MSVDNWPVWAHVQERSRVPPPMDRLESHWNDILTLVRSRVSSQTFDTWFRPLQPASRQNGSLCVVCPNHFFRDWFSEHHQPMLREAATQYFGHAILCELVVDEAEHNRQREIFVPQAPDDSFARGQHSRRDGGSLNPDYTFDSFVVGKGSEMVHAAAVAVSRKPGDHFNPVFIHGGVGLGKTHLLHAIGNAVLVASPGRRVRYVAAENFMNDLIRAIQENSTYQFKRHYRDVDVLLVDDVAFLAGKESTQEEFFHTFNTLYNARKQIVLTSDRSPKEITTLEERLRSRFEWGLIADIQPPDLETRMAILHKKVELNNIYMSQDVIEYLAENITSNIRRLEGALLRLQAFASLAGKEISLEMASEALSSFFQAGSKGSIMIADVMQVVDDHYGVTTDQLKSKRRTRELALARQVAMYIARERIGASLNKIGREFGDRDHTTVLHACQKVQKQMEQDPHLRGTIKELLSRL
jgi:chromosomal replication initiator protein